MFFHIYKALLSNPYVYSKTNNVRELTPSKILRCETAINKEHGQELEIVLMYISVIQPLVG